MRVVQIYSEKQRWESNHFQIGMVTFGETKPVLFGSVKDLERLLRSDELNEYKILAVTKSNRFLFFKNKPLHDFPAILNRGKLSTTQVQITWKIPYLSDFCTASCFGGKHGELYTILKLISQGLYKSYSILPARSQKPTDCIVVG